MNITRTDKDNLNAFLTITLEKPDYEEHVEKALRDIRRKANINGFRPGMVPFGMIKKMYGKAVLVDEINKLVSDQLTNYLVENKVDILGNPMPSVEKEPVADWENSTNFEFTFDIGLTPEVPVKLSKRDKVPYYQVIIDDEILDTYKKSYLKRFGTHDVIEVADAESMVKGIAEQCDDSEAVVDGGFRNENAMFLPKMIKNEEIKKIVVGKKSGDAFVFDINEAFEGNSSEISSFMGISKDEAELLNKVRFTITEISGYKDAEVNQEFFDKAFGEDKVHSVEEFEEKLKEEIRVNLEQESHYRFYIDARKKLVEKVKFELPDDFLKRWLLSQNEKLTTEEVEKDYDLFKEDLKWQLIKDTIAKENEMNVTEEELKEIAKQYAAQQFRQYGLYYATDEHLESFAGRILSSEEERKRLFEKKIEDKVIDFVKESVHLDNKEITKEEMDKLYQK